MEIGTKIRNARIKKNMSQVQLAELLGTSQAMVTAYESGKRVPKLETIERIATALDLSVLSLLPSNLTEGAVFPSDQEEKELFEILSSLNRAGKRKVCDYASDISENQKYRN